MTWAVQISDFTHSELKCHLEFKWSYSKCKNQSRFTYGNLPAKPSHCRFPVCSPRYPFFLANKVPWNGTYNGNIIFNIIINHLYYCNHCSCCLFQRLVLPGGHCKWYPVQVACGNATNLKCASLRHFFYRLSLSIVRLTIKKHLKILRYLKAEYTLQWAYKDLDSYPSSAIKFVCSVSRHLLLQEDKCYTEALNLDWSKFVSCSTLDVNFSNTQKIFFSSMKCR